ncbi:GDSL esterase/lipase At5g55050-like [Bidens hawaiensis]|uniref:GDSL esterase/lipase At5g55050-like n=1 Tax=Bidens hawaiensis TaxID=980011 RepID=UPI00404A37AE
MHVHNMAITSHITGVGATMALLVCILVFICKAQAATPAVYILGDSLLDVGNNNYLPLSLLKANFPHNGVDFPTGKPTGRFSNGQNAADFLVKKIGLPTPPSYLSLSSATPPITGVNLASGGAGIFEETGGFLVSTFKGLLKTLYGLGARKLVVSGVGAVGCCPIKRKENRTGECNVEINYWSTKYNDGLKIMLEGLKAEPLGMNYAYSDTYGAMVDLFQNHEAYGYSEIKEACCGIGNLKADGPCIPLATYCSNRTNHVFWDLYHPTETIASLFAGYLYSGSQQFMVPMNVEQLLAL